MIGTARNTSQASEEGIKWKKGVDQRMILKGTEEK